MIGVMPAGFGFPDRGTQLWVPQTLAAGDWDAIAAQRGTGAWRVVGRVHPGVSLERARQEMRVVARRLEAMHARRNAGLGIDVVALHDQVTGRSFRLALWTLFGAVGLVLMIACANVAHLFLVRGIDRAPEAAVRAAFGATTSRLIRQALVESMVLAVAAALAGALLAAAALRLLVALAPASAPRLDEIAVDPAVLAYGLAVSLGAGMLLGIMPVLRGAGRAPYDALREGRGAARRTPAQRARGLLIAGQFALAIILVFEANLLIRSSMAASRVDPGFRADDVLMANLSVEAEPRRVPFYDDVVQRVRALPGVRGVGLVEDVFISGARAARLNRLAEVGLVRVGWRPPEQNHAAR